MITQANAPPERADIMEILRERDPKFFALLHDPEFAAAIDRLLRPLLTPVFSGHGVGATGIS